MDSLLDQPLDFTADALAAMQTPRNLYPFEVAITGDAEIEVRFPTDVKGANMGCHFFVIDSDIPIYVAYATGKTASAVAPNAAADPDARYLVRSALPITTRTRRDRIFIRPRVSGTTGTVHIICAN